MKYEKPKCDCGKELVVSREQFIEVRFKINKNGSESKNPFSKTKPGFNEDGFNALICPYCNSSYEFFFEDNRIYRGEKIF